MTQNKKSNDLIFRKQSLWLLLASLLSAGVFFFDLYRIPVGTEAAKELKVANHFPSLLIALVMVALPLITVFMYRDRKRQIRFCAVSMLSCASFVSLTLFRVSNDDAAGSGSYWIGGILPVVAMVFVVLALMAIRRDDKLVRSTDRLR